MLGPDQIPLPGAAAPEQTVMLALWRGREQQLVA